VCEEVREYVCVSVSVRERESERDGCVKTFVEIAKVKAILKNRR